MDKKSNLKSIINKLCDLELRMQEHKPKVYINNVDKFFKYNPINCKDQPH